MGDTIRIGKVSSIDYSTGKVKVTYPDRDNAVTSSISCLAAGEYNMPAVGEMVLVAHMSNGTENGVCLGTINNKVQTPAISGKGNFHKKLGSASMKTSGGSLSLTDKSGTISVGLVLQMLERIETLEQTVIDQQTAIDDLTERVEALGG